MAVPVPEAGVVGAEVGTLPLRVVVFRAAIAIRSTPSDVAVARGIHRTSHRAGAMVAAGLRGVAEGRARRPVPEGLAGVAVQSREVTLARAGPVTVDAVGAALRPGPVAVACLRALGGGIGTKESLAAHTGPVHAALTASSAGLASFAVHRALAPREVPSPATLGPCFSHANLGEQLERWGGVGQSFDRSVVISRLPRFTATNDAVYV